MDITDIPVPSWISQYPHGYLNIHMDIPVSTWISQYLQWISQYPHWERLRSKPGDIKAPEDTHHRGHFTGENPPLLLLLLLLKA